MIVHSNFQIQDVKIFRARQLVLCYTIIINCKKASVFAAKNDTSFKPIFAM